MHAPSQFHISVDPEIAILSILAVATNMTIALLLVFHPDGHDPQADRDRSHALTVSPAASSTMHPASAAPSPTTSITLSASPSTMKFPSESTPAFPSSRPRLRAVGCLLFHAAQPYRDHQPVSLFEICLLCRGRRPRFHRGCLARELTARLISWSSIDPASSRAVGARA